MARLKKIADHVFNEKHPNGINTGFERKIELGAEGLKSPRVGTNYWFGYIRTSTVIEIMEDSPEKKLFRTRNSTYEVTI